MPIKERDFWSDPTFENALRRIEKPEMDLADWERDDGTSIIFLNSKSIVRLGGSKLEHIGSNSAYHRQSVFIALAEQLISKKISRKSLNEWESFGLFEKGRNDRNFKYYSQDALHELHASWLLAKRGRGKIRCTFREAGTIRNIFIHARDNGTLDEDGILRFIGPGELVNRDNPRWAPKNANHENMLIDARLNEWLRYMVLSQHGKDPLSTTYILHFTKTTNLETGELTYGTYLT